LNVENDKSVKITIIYRKATHADQYLNFQSNHHIKQKIGIISTFRHRINELVTKEEAHERCGHPKWWLKKRNHSRKEQ